MNNNIPQGYKDSPLGVIPQEWEVKRLGEVGSVVSGLTYSPEDVTVKDDGILVLRSSNIQNRQLVFDDNVYVNVDKFNPVKANDILICVRNGSRNLIGKNALITNQVDGVAFGAFMSVFRSEVSSYLIHLFDTDLFNRNVHKNLGATINSINGSELKEFKFPLPPLPEQQRIAEVLGTWDVAIEKQGALVDKLTERKRALMQQLLTGKKRLPNFSEPWETVRLGEISNVIMGQSPSSTAYNVEQIGLPLIQGNADLSNRITMPRMWTSEVTKKCDVNDLIMSVRAPVGDIAKSTLRACIGRGVCAIRCNNKSNIEYLYNALLFIEDKISSMGQGSTFSAINSTDIKNITLSIPTLIEQTAIAQILTTADREIEGAKAKLESLRSQKRGLMQQLLTGKKRMKI